MTPEERERLLEWLPPSLHAQLDEDGYLGPRGDGPLDERTPGFFRIPGMRQHLIERDRERLIGEFTD